MSSKKRSSKKRSSKECQLCGSIGVTKKNCPLNPNAKKPSPSDHPNVKMSSFMVIASFAIDIKGLALKPNYLFGYKFRSFEYINPKTNEFPYERLKPLPKKLMKNAETYGIQITKGTKKQLQNMTNLLETTQVRRGGLNKYGDIEMHPSGPMFEYKLNVKAVDSKAIEKWIYSTGSVPVYIGGDGEGDGGYYDNWEFL